MASTVALSHLETFNNLNTHEKFSSLEKKSVYGFGVQGKKFVLVQTTDSLLSRIWFSVLKFLRFIKVEQPAIVKFLAANKTHFDLKAYQDWAAKDNKLLPSEIVALKGANAALKANNAAKSAALTTTQSELEATRKSGEKSRKRSKEKSKEIQTLNKQIQSLEVQSTVTNLTKDRLTAIIRNLKPKFDFSNSAIENWIRDKKIVVQHNVEEVVSTAKAAAAAGASVGAAAASKHAIATITPLPQGDDTLVKKAS